MPNWDHSHVIQVFSTSCMSKHIESINLPPMLPLSNVGHICVLNVILLAFIVSFVYFHINEI